MKAFYHWIKLIVFSVGCLVAVGSCEQRYYLPDCEMAVSFPKGYQQYDGNHFVNLKEISEIKFEIQNEPYPFKTESQLKDYCAIEDYLIKTRARLMEVPFHGKTFYLVYRKVGDDHVYSYSFGDTSQFIKCEFAGKTLTETSVRSILKTIKWRPKRPFTKSTVKLMDLDFEIIPPKGYFRIAGAVNTELVYSNKNHNKYLGPMKEFISLSEIKADTGCYNVKCLNQKYLNATALQDIDIYKERFIASQKDAYETFANVERFLPNQKDFLYFGVIKKKGRYFLFMGFGPREKSAGYENIFRQSMLSLQVR